MKGLSNRQQQILDFIKKKLIENKFSPTAEDISKELGITSGAVYGHLERLEKKGKIRRLPNQARSIVLINSPTTNNDEIIKVPVVGQVTAGQPILAHEQIEGYFPIIKHNVNPDEVFALRIKGDSMINAGILDGDYVIVKKQKTAENGEIVVAMVEDDEATVKRFYREDGFCRLQPANDKYLPLIVREVIILGKVIGMYRNALIEEYK